MATKKIQDISQSGSYKLAAANTWYQLANQLLSRKSIDLVNSGVDNDLATGTIYVTFNNTGNAETEADMTSPKLLVLDAGSSYSKNITSDVTINVRGSDADICVHLIESDSEHISGLQDS